MISHRMHNFLFKTEMMFLKSFFFLVGDKNNIYFLKFIFNINILNRYKNI
jgi:hypothetical protein